MNHEHARTGAFRSTLALLAALLFAQPHAATAAGVVGSGTPESCTEAALDMALATGGVVTFDCGPEPMTITVTTTKTIVQNTVIDGGERITIDGQRNVGIFSVSSEVRFDMLNLAVANGNGRLGGAISNAGGTVSLANSSISGSFASLGGGIANDPGGNMLIADSALTANEAGNGGAIMNGSTTFLRRATLAHTAACP